jgi:hypothetical protein
MTPAMTSIAVTAINCANAPEAVRLVASFMPVSLDLDATHQCAKDAQTTAVIEIRNTRDEMLAGFTPAHNEHRLR